MRFLLCCLLLLAALPPAHAAPPPALSASALCETAITAAEQRAKTPARMLAAIALVESGRPDPATGKVRPWPWTIDVNGAGQFFATKAQAVAAVAQLQAQGIRSIDVGCMQVNLMHHPTAFATLDQAFDPIANAAYAVRFLNSLFSQTGNWPSSIAAYHSSTPGIGTDYEHRVLIAWRQLAAPAMRPARYADDRLIYGRVGTTGRVFGLLAPKPIGDDAQPAPRR